MKTKKMLFVLSSAVIMSACNDTIVEEVKPTAPQKPKTTVYDTVRVIGVFNQPSSYGHCKTKFIHTVNKQGKKYFLTQELYDIDNNNLVALFTERGDTIVIDNQGNISKNITMERLQSEYVNSR